MKINKHLKVVIFLKCFLDLKYFNIKTGGSKHQNAFEFFRLVEKVA